MTSASAHAAHDRDGPNPLVVIEQRVLERAKDATGTAVKSTNVAINVGSAAAAPRLRQNRLARG